jgi:hypothetical protein
MSLLDSGAPIIGVADWDPAILTGWIPPIEMLTAPVKGIQRKPFFAFCALLIAGNGPALVMAPDGGFRARIRPGIYYKILVGQCIGCHDTLFYRKSPGL